ncbi:tetratricopeptide repeat protein [Bradyrhizobium sp. Tv2a-2]|uniref:tetratricopeptide repeat protein n=1 Tax=Bradyrhizobium sp. Tv2a-2 TaxID=113395 RepID=UPI0004052227|nr:tetratricopeptide repeat protein [Bradyrhizobium sp. Tv2a-2]
MDRRDRQAIAEAVEAAPAAAVGVTLYQTVLGHLRAGRHLDARLSCRQALERDPENAETLHLMALVCFNAGQFDHAIEWISQAIRKDPRPAYLTLLGTALLNLRRHDDALLVFDKAVQLRPDDASLWNNLGNACIESNRLSDAIASFQRALAIDPVHWDSAYKAGVMLQQQRRFDEALACLDICKRLKPDDAPTLHIRAMALHGLKRFDDALSDNRRAQALDAQNPHIQNNLGRDLAELGRPEEALSWFDSALKVRPDFVEALNNKAFALTQLHRFDEAVAVYGRVRHIDPENAQATWDLALLNLLLGNFAEGWAGREARFRLPSHAAPYPKFRQPLWLGEGDIAGKTILLYADEGLGDTIQFARYFQPVAARGARVVVAVADAVRPLLSGISGVAECVSKSGALPAFDLHCPISSLPLAFATTLTTIPDGFGYLPPPPADRVQAWEDRLGCRNRLRVGLVWSGNPRQANDHNRSMPLATLARILDVDATFVSLQKEPRPQDKAALAESTIIDVSADLTDFVQTAALVSCLDLVITVCTSVAHLAAALGRPTWVLLCHTPDYRWLLDRDDSPWYPSVRLFRQNEARDYASVVERARAELAALVATKN